MSAFLLVCSAGQVQAQLLTGFGDAAGPSVFEREVQPPSYSEPLPVPVSEPAFERPVRPVAVDRTERAYSSFLTAPRHQEGGDVFASSHRARGAAVGAVPEKSQEPVSLQADDMMHDQSTQSVVASGHVILEQAGRVLEADQIRYDVAQNRVTAIGDVMLVDVSGDVHKADQVELQDDLKDGVVQELQSILVDGSRFKASRGEREGGVKTTMHQAAYTPCELCEENPDADPLWQLRASEVVYQEDESRIDYRNARFEFMGVPMLYTPYFSHYDGSVEQKSGFLSPSGGYKSDLGAFIANSYYYAIAPDQDATASLQVHTKENPLLLGQWRKGWDNARLTVDGGVTYSERPDQEAGVRVRQDEEVRGHVFAEGIWNMNDKWRSGLNVQYSSDDQYLRQYDLSGEDVLESEIYAERFSGRNYAVGRVLTFQDVRIRDKQIDQPEVLPEVIASFIGEPGAVPVVGGRWDVEGSLLGLRREGNEQDVERLSLQGGWERRLISDTGLLTDVRTQARGDFYNVRDKTDAAQQGEGDNVNEARFFPQAHIETSYPMARSFEAYQAVVEPVVAVTLAPNIDVNEQIPNEDSLDTQIDSSNIFELSRFPGLDVVEDKNRMTYGMRTGLYGYDGSHVKMFLGQSRRFDDGGNPFSAGSGLEAQNSDYVGELTANYQNRHIMNYKFQLDQAGFSSERHEAYLYNEFGDFRLGNRYLFAKGLEGTDIDESRQQIQSGASYDLTDNWRVRSGGIYDLGETPGLREAYVGFDYAGQCMSWSVTGERNLTDDASGESSTEIMFRVGLKNLGDYETSRTEDYLDDELRP